MRKTIVILLISLIFCVMSFCLGSIDPPESGIFNGIPIINLASPENEITINFDPVFKWEKIENKIGIVSDIDIDNDNDYDDIILFPIEVVIVFSNPINVEAGSTPKITNLNDAKYMWDSTLPFGVPGEVNLGNFKVVERIEVIYNDIKYPKLKYVNPIGTTSNDEPPPTFSNLTEPKTFYWVVIAYSPDGDIVRASKEYKFTYDKDYLPPS